MAAKELMPLLSECDCIYSDRNEPLCPCRSMRALLGREFVYCEECKSRHTVAFGEEFHGRILQERQAPSAEVKDG
jgi:hypothetical protein